MQYLGGKSRLAPKFAPILLEALRAGSGRLVEPFVGGFNVVPALRRLGWHGPAVCTDLHPGLAHLYQALQAGWEPPAEMSRERRETLRILEDWSNPETAFAAFGMSFAGKAWDTYAFARRGEDFAGECARSLCRKARAMASVTFACIDYRGASVGPGAVVYADPPYAGATEYSTGPFDTPAFLEQCEAWASCGARVFVSEFTHPGRPGWIERWRIERSIQIRGKISESGGPKRADLLLEVVDVLL